MKSIWSDRVFDWTDRVLSEVRLVLFSSFLVRVVLVMITGGIVEQWTGGTMERWNDGTVDRWTVTVDRDGVDSSRLYWYSWKEN